MQLVLWVSYPPTPVVLTYMYIVITSSFREPRVWARFCDHESQAANPFAHAAACTLHTWVAPCWCSTRLVREAFGCRDWKSSRPRLCYATSCFIGCSLALTPAEVFFLHISQFSSVSQAETGISSIPISASAKDKPTGIKRTTSIKERSFYIRIWKGQIGKMSMYFYCTCTFIHGHRTHWDDESTPT